MKDTLLPQISNDREATIELAILLIEKSSRNPDDPSNTLWLDNARRLLTEGSPMEIRSHLTNDPYAYNALANLLLTDSRFGHKTDRAKLVIEWLTKAPPDSIRDRFREISRIVYMLYYAYLASDQPDQAIKCLMDSSGARLLPCLKESRALPLLKRARSLRRAQLQRQVLASNSSRNGSPLAMAAFPPGFSFEGEIYKQWESGAQGTVYVNAAKTLAITIFDHVPGVDEKHLSALVDVVQDLRRNSAPVSDMRRVIHVDVPGVGLMPAVLMEFVDGESVETLYQELVAQWPFRGFGELGHFYSEALLSVLDEIDRDTGGLSDRPWFKGLESRLSLSNFLRTPAAMHRGDASPVEKTPTVRVLEKKEVDGTQEIKCAVEWLSERAGLQRVVFVVNAPAGNGPFPTAFSFHGWQSSKQEPLLVDLASALVKEGYAVVRPDFRNNRTDPATVAQGRNADNGNESTGDVRTFEWAQSLQDVDIIFAALKNHPDLFPSLRFDSTLLLGHSYGGWTARALTVRSAEEKNTLYAGLQIQAVFDFAGTVQPMSALFQLIRRRLPPQWRDSNFLETRIRQKIDEWRQSHTAPVSSLSFGKSWRTTGEQLSETNLKKFDFLRVAHHYFVGSYDRVILVCSSVEKLMGAHIARHENDAPESRVIVVKGLKHSFVEPYRSAVIGEVLAILHHAQAEIAPLQILTVGAHPPITTLTQDALHQIFADRERSTASPFHELIVHLAVRFNSPRRDVVRVPTFRSVSGTTFVSLDELKMHDDGAIYVTDELTHFSHRVAELKEISSPDRTVRLELARETPFDHNALRQILWTILEPALRAQEWHLLAEGNGEPTAATSLLKSLGEKLKILMASPHPSERQFAELLDDIIFEAYGSPRLQEMLEDGMSNFDSNIKHREVEGLWSRRQTATPEDVLMACALLLLELASERTTDKFHAADLDYLQTLIDLYNDNAFHKPKLREDIPSLFNLALAPPFQNADAFELYSKQMRFLPHEQAIMAVAFDSLCKVFHLKGVVLGGIDGRRDFDIIEDHLNFMFDMRRQTDLTDRDRIALNIGIGALFWFWLLIKLEKEQIHRRIENFTDDLPQRLQDMFMKNIDLVDRSYQEMWPEQLKLKDPFLMGLVWTYFLHIRNEFFTVAPPSDFSLTDVLLDPKNPHAAAYLQGRLEEAASRLEKFRKNPDSTNDVTWVYYVKGWASKRRQFYFDAIKMYQRRQAPALLSYLFFNSKFVSRFFPSITKSTNAQVLIAAFSFFTLPVESHFVYAAFVSGTGLAWTGLILGLGAHLFLIWLSARQSIRGSPIGKTFLGYLVLLFVYWISPSLPVPAIAIDLSFIHLKLPLAAFVAHLFYDGFLLARYLKNVSIVDSLPEIPYRTPTYRLNPPNRFYQSRDDDWFYGRVPPANLELTIPILPSPSSQFDGGFREHLEKDDPHQSYVPDDPDLLKKLGINVGESVFGFAGFVGDWLAALMELGANVTYTDIDARIVEWVKQNRPFNNPRIASPLMQPALPNQYDWSFSFEPVPLDPSVWPLVLLRSLLNKKGMMWVTSMGDTDGSTWQLKEFANIYGLRGNIDLAEDGHSNTRIGDDFDKRIVTIRSKNNRGFSRLDRNMITESDVPDPLSFPKNNLFLAITVRTNYMARSHAVLDLAVFQVLQDGASEDLDQLRSELKKRGLNPRMKDLVQSAQRLTKLTALLRDVEKKTIVLKSQSVGSAISATARALASTNPVDRLRGIFPAPNPLDVGSVQGTQHGREAIISEVRRLIEDEAAREHMDIRTITPERYASLVWTVNADINGSDGQYIGHVVLAVDPFKKDLERKALAMLDSSADELVLVGRPDAAQALQSKLNATHPFRIRVIPTYNAIKKGRPNLDAILPLLAKEQNPITKAIIVFDDGFVLSHDTVEFYEKAQFTFTVIPWRNYVNQLLIGTAVRLGVAEQLLRTVQALIDA